MQRRTTMRKIVLALFLTGFGLVFSSCSDKEQEKTLPVPELRFEKPAHFPEPVYNLSRNPVTRRGFELGRALFYDPLLSIDGNISCGSCHQQSAGFTHHGHSLSHGINDQLGRRNAPPVMNLAWGKQFMWDGGIFDLDLFPPAPITNPVEMGETLDGFMGKIRRSARYRKLFQRAYGDDSITFARTMMAMSQFMLMCVSARSPYDDWRQGKGSLSAEALEGYRLVQEKCASCHAGELFTDHSFRNNGLAPAAQTMDKGRYEITLQESDKFRFKVPSLRNLDMTGPYMHDGRFLTLEAVLDHYSGGVRDLPNLDPLLVKDGQRGIPLTAQERTQILAFLKTLNDPFFQKDENLSEFSVKE